MFYETTIHDSHRYAAKAAGAGGPIRLRGLAAVLVACAALAIAFPSFASANSAERHVASGAATVRSEGSTTVRLHFTAAARRSPASKRIVKLTIGAPGIRSAAMTLKR